MIRVPIHNRSESEFAWQQELAGKTWFHQPKKFPLPRPWASYTPDFYVIEDGCFYEVLGSVGARCTSEGKRAAFRKRYPHLKLVEVEVGAWKEGPRGRMRNPPPRSAERLQYETKGWAGATPKKPLAIEVVRLAKQAGIKSYTELGLFVGLPYSRLWTAINRTHPATEHLELALGRLRERVHANGNGVPA